MREAAFKLDGNGMAGTFTLSLYELGDGFQLTVAPALATATLGG